MTLSANQVLYPQVRTLDGGAAARPGTEFMAYRPADNSDPANLLPSRADVLAGAFSLSGIGATSGYFFVFGSNGLLVPRLITAADLSGLAVAASALSQSTGAFIPGSRYSQSFFSDGVGAQLWTAKAPCKVISVTEIHVSPANSADTLTMEKVPSGTAAGSGTVVLAGNFTLNSTANTNVTVNGHGTLATASLAAGDSLAFKYVSGDGTGWLGALTVTVEWL